MNLVTASSIAVRAMDEGLSVQPRDMYVILLSTSSVDPLKELIMMRLGI